MGADSRHVTYGSALLVLLSFLHQLDLFSPLEVSGRLHKTCLQPKGKVCLIKFVACEILFYKTISEVVTW